MLLKRGGWPARCRGGALWWPPRSTTLSGHFRRGPRPHRSLPLGPRRFRRYVGAFGLQHGGVLTWGACSRSRSGGRTRPARCTAGSHRSRPARRGGSSARAAGVGASCWVAVLGGGAGWCCWVQVLGGGADRARSAGACARPHPDHAMVVAGEGAQGGRQWAGSRGGRSRPGSVPPRLHPHPPFPRPLAPRRHCTRARSTSARFPPRRFPPRRASPRTAWRRRPLPRETANSARCARAECRPRTAASRGSRPRDRSRCSRDGG